MFGLKKFNDKKTKKFDNDKKRKQYYAIKNYYKTKNATVKSKNSTKCN